MSASSATEFDEIITETEIVFTASPVFEEAFSPEQTDGNEKEAQDTHSETAPLTHTNDPQDQDAAAKQQVERLKAKLENNQQLRGSSEQQNRQLRFRQLVNETKSLNRESQKFNTQSAVLLSALTSLKTDLETSESEKLTIMKELAELKNTFNTLVEQLQTEKSDARKLNTRSAATQEDSEKLIAELNQLKTETLTQQQSGHALLGEFERDRNSIAERHQESENNSSNIKEMVAVSQALLDKLQTADKDSIDRANELDELLGVHNNAKTEIDDLVQSLQSLQAELLQEKQTQRQLNSDSKAQLQQTEKLNQQQVTLIELTQSRHDELKNELQVALDTSKKYQTRLQQTETRLKDATDLQVRYQEQYANALTKLESNETLLKNAAKALAEANGQNGKFNSSISKFQHANEQSQQLVLRTQTTLESILSRNQLLERENKLLAQKVNSLSGNSLAQSNSAPSGLANLADLQFPDPQVHTHNPPEGKNSFYKLMVALAILIPLTFIAHSLLTSSNALESGGSFVVNTDTVTSDRRSVLNSPVN